MGFLYGSRSEKLKFDRSVVLGFEGKVSPCSA